MDLKAQIRLAILTAVSLLEGFAPNLKLDPRLVAAIQLAKHLVNEHWDELWALAHKNPEFGKLLASIPSS